MTYSPSELAAFLKERSLLKVLDEKVLQGICQLFQEIHCGPGHIVFTEGDEADSIYIIAEGSVEVIQGNCPPKVIAYLTTGDCFGEMALMHDTTRNATIRVPEEAIVLKLSRRAFNELKSHFPELAKEVTKIINRRLSGKLSFTSPGLAGNLAFFDLPTIVQTVTGSGQIGLINLRGHSGKLIAQLYVRQGKLAHASFLHLTGEHALYELLTRNEPVDFMFERQGELDAGLPIDKSLAQAQPYKLLMEGARRADELPALMEKLGWPNTVFLPATSQPAWSNLSQDLESIARKTWFLLEAGLTVQQLSHKLPYDRYSVLLALGEMLTAKLICPKSGAPKTLGDHARQTVNTAKLINAINAIVSNLGHVLGAETTHLLLTQALKEATTKYSNLASLKIHPHTGTLDLRAASPDVSQSETSAEALRCLTLTFLRLAGQDNTS
ncbi:MAG: cyclic nucleotide-binding domain-containing protein [Candidatus Melainabacteria bacterium]|nr:cyclic nucleotide-binding domain-containing protein [Candidatus Melainabacteria bacterium]